MYKLILLPECFVLTYVTWLERDNAVLDMLFLKKKLSVIVNIFVLSAICSPPVKLFSFCFHELVDSRCPWTSSILVASKKSIRQKKKKTHRIKDWFVRLNLKMPAFCACISFVTVVVRKSQTALLATRIELVRGHRESASSWKKKKKSAFPNQQMVGREC